MYMCMCIATASSTIHPPASSNTHIQAAAVSYLHVQANPQLQQQILRSKSSEATQSGDQATISRITGGCLCTCGVYAVSTTVVVFK